MAAFTSGISRVGSDDRLNSPTVVNATVVAVPALAAARFSVPVSAVSVIVPASIASARIDAPIVTGTSTGLPFTSGLSRAGSDDRVAGGGVAPSAVNATVTAVPGIANARAGAVSGIDVTVGPPAAIAVASLATPAANVSVTAVPAVAVARIDAPTIPLLPSGPALSQADANYFLLIHA